MVRVMCADCTAPASGEMRAKGELLITSASALRGA